MLRLVTLGGLTLVDASRQPLVTQRLRLALLALLAAAGERGTNRDKVVALLWPERPTENARHALQQLLYSLRRQVHEEIFLGTDQLRLNPSLVTSDLLDFREAIEADDSGRAIATYGGPFLDGFFLAESAAFDEWVEAERGRLAAEYQQALTRRARQAGEQAQHTMEIDSWRKLAALDRLSERSALGLIRALLAAGEVAEATRYARTFEALLQRELGTGPETDLNAFIEQGRRGSPRPAEASPGATPGERFVIERELGRGSAATVYLAHDQKLNRPVALKVLKPSLAVSVEGKRFLREIEIVARMHHPHILQLYDSGELPATDRGPRLFYAMPYVQGESLRQRLEREARLPAEEAVRLAREVADALGYAHGRGVVHRDIKPANILLESGHALVADFGVAHALQIAGNERLSGISTVVGTPAYMSPEQALPGATLDGRSDQYSLACVLYEMLAGVPPFAAASPIAVLARHAVDPVPSLLAARPDVPPAVARAVQRALAKTPDERFATVTAFAEALGTGTA